MEWVTENIKSLRALTCQFNLTAASAATNISRLGGGEKNQEKLKDLVQ